jgi:hypothetical protein
MSSNVVTHKDRSPRLKCGYVREDGMVFLAYNKESKNGERWVTPEKFAERLEQQRSYRETNRQACRERGRRYHAANKDKIREARKTYRKNDPERFRKYNRDWAKANPDKILEKWLIRKYGISLSEYKALLKNQNGRCAICETRECATGNRMAVDHDHVTGAVRGILCKACNTGIGGLRDDPKLLLKAINYLKPHSL